MERGYRWLRDDGQSGGVRKCSDLGLLYGMAYLSCEYWISLLLTLFITASHYNTILLIYFALILDPQVTLVSSMGMSRSSPPMRFGWKVKEMSDASTKRRPNCQPVDSDIGGVLTC